MRGVEQIPWLYDLSMALMPGVRRWRRSLAALARGRVLEVGCGTGQMLPLYPESVELFGLDPNPDALERARRRGPDVALLRGSAEYLPFPDQSFDTVVSGLVFCSVPDPARGLAEIRRVLEPDGRLLMLEHVHARNRAGRWLLDTLQPPWTLVSGGCRPNRDTEKIVENAGFCIERTHYRASGVMRHFVARKAAK
ncbi:MAG: methyltransferase domain-containing protein [Wenzhouxiangellaceae bacterium]|nr:methyltransferase domain-containing protein [Wenzhouxiangellaceae bacterium]